MTAAPRQRLLFLCSKNRLRSPTAADHFAARPDLETDSAGLLHDAQCRLAPDQLEWADLIFVMEKSQLQRLRRDYAPYLNNKRVLCLNIPDDYSYMDPRLIALLDAKVLPLLH